MIRMLLPVMTAGVVLYLTVKKKITASVTILCLLMTVIAAGMLFSESTNGGREKIRRLEENSETDAYAEIPLEVKTDDGKDHAVTIQIPAKQYSAEEEKAFLQKKAGELDREILGKNQSFERIEWNLTLPTSFEDVPVTCTWESDHPDLVDDSGKLGMDIPQEGTEVILTGILQMGEEEQTYEKAMRVYPSLEEETFAETLQRESERLNEAGKDKKGFRLPETLHGQSLKWYRKKEQRGGFICLLVMFAAIFSVVIKNNKKKQAHDKYREELNREYPDLVSKIQLLTAAGMSLRRCMGRLAKEYPEVNRCWREMESGVTEQEAYAHFGERCGTPAYRKLSLLLAQSQKKGGQQLSALLEQEVQEAFETRKRNARAEGEKTSIRMILPMGLMLMIVMVVVMVPAMLSMQ